MPTNGRAGPAPEILRTPHRRRQNARAMSSTGWPRCSRAARSARVGRLESVVREVVTFVQGDLTTRGIQLPAAAGERAEVRAAIAFSCSSSCSTSC